MPFPVDHDLIRQLRAHPLERITFLCDQFTNHPGLVARKVDTIVATGSPAGGKIATLQRTGKRRDVQPHGLDRPGEKPLTLRKRRKCVIQGIRNFRKKLLILAVS